MDSAKDVAQPKAQGHGRQASHAKPQATERPRSSTIGPLEAVDPVTELPQASPQHSLSPSTASSPLAAGRKSHDMPPALIEQSLHEFGQLLEQDVFHPLTQFDVPAAFQDSVANHSEGKSLPELLSRGYFRAAAILAANQLVYNTSKTDHEKIFSLFYVRLACLQILGLHVFAAQEVKALQDLNEPFYREPITNKHLMPWELRVIAIRLQALGFGDWRRGVMAYYDLAQEARHELGRCSPAEKQLWKDRLEDLGVRVGNALVEMGDFDGAIRHLETLPARSYDHSSRWRIAMILLRVGDIGAARKCMQKFDNDPDNVDYVDQILKPMCTMATSKHDEAADEWSRLKECYPDEVMITSNLAACLVYAGRISEARDHLEKLVEQGNVNRGITFNLSTIYELCSEQSQELKQGLVKKAAVQEPSSRGWERSNIDFKL